MESRMENETQLHGFFFSVHGLIPAKNVIPSCKAKSVADANASLSPSPGAHESALGANRGSWPRQAMSPSLTTVFLSVLRTLLPGLCPVVFLLHLGGDTSTFFSENRFLLPRPRSMNFFHVKVCHNRELSYVLFDD